VKQFDFFSLIESSQSVPSAPPLPVSPIVGLAVRLPAACRCGSHIGVVGSSCGPHQHRIDCKQCGTWRQWLGRAEAAFITQINCSVGAPTTPIVLRPREGVS